MEKDKIQGAAVIEVAKRYAPEYDEAKVRQEYLKQCPESNRFKNN